MLVRQRVERLVKQIAFPSGIHANVSQLPSSKLLSLETCVLHVMNNIPFSADILFQSICNLQGELWICGQVYAKIGSSFRPIIVTQTTETTSPMRPEDVIYLLCALIEEVELELIQLRRDGIELATCESLRDAWTIDEQQ